MKTKLVSRQTQSNWWIDASLFTGGLLAALTGIYFLFLPVGGYQGGRNPQYGLRVLFERSTWDDLHTWSGVAMIAFAVVHLIIHWSWVVNMSRRIFRELITRRESLNWRGRWNLILNVIVGLSFSLAAISSVYFLYFPGGSNSAAASTVIFTRTAWDMLHTWSGTVLILAALVHFAIHWRWVTKVTSKIGKSFVGRLAFVHPQNPTVEM
jgi:hypothetical protein